MKFLALNVYFSNPSLDPLGSRKPAHPGVKEGIYPSKKWPFIRCRVVYNVKLIADRHRHAANHNKHWRRASQKCQH